MIKFVGKKLSGLPGEIPMVGIKDAEQT